MRRLYSNEKSKGGGNKMKGKQEKERRRSKNYHGSLSHRRQHLLSFHVQEQN
jgi:hypothetical protein